MSDDLKGCHLDDCKSQAVSSSEQVAPVPSEDRDSRNVVFRRFVEIPPRAGCRVPHLKIAGSAESVTRGGDQPVRANREGTFSGREVTSLWMIRMTVPNVNLASSQSQETHRHPSPEGVVRGPETPLPHFAAVRLHRCFHRAAEVGVALRELRLEVREQPQQVVKH